MTTFDSILSKDSNSVRLCDSATLRSMFGGRSDMWLWRRLKDGTLPRPVIISGRRYWLQDEIDALIERLTSARVLKNEAA